jgi:hypothetical protein
MKRYEFKLVTVDRIAVREPDSKELQKLNELGNEGWRIITVRDDVQHSRDIVVMLERERE